MIEPKWTEILKFVALRPSQLVTEKETRYPLFHDPRSSNPDGEIQLVRLARKLATSGVVLEQWNKLDLIDLRRLRAEGTPWEFTLPTTLVWLQPELLLPVFP